MISIKIKKGCFLNIGGKPSPDSEELGKPLRVAMLPEKIPFIKPRLLVKPNYTVKIGSPLFEDKRQPVIRFLSPGAGKVKEINFGPRRIVREIVIELDDKEDFVGFEAFSENDIQRIDREKLVNAILNGGLWHLIREFPFRDIARYKSVPPAIFVSLGAMEPFHPQPEIYLKGQQDLFLYGISVLKKLAPQVFIAASQDSASVLKDGIITHLIDGHYPADDPGVFLYHAKTSAAENRSWYISGQDILLLAQLLKTGKYPIERTITLGGSMAAEKKHIKTRIGAPLSHIVRERILHNGKSPRYVVGGIFRGYAASPESYMSLYETSLTLIPDSDEREFLSFIRPGYDKPSFSKTFLSVFNKAPSDMSANLRGEERGCVGCNSCVKVCPVDIMPNFAFKSVMADEIEEALAHGLLDCVECGLCSYVCTSKIEICDILKKSKAKYYNEQAAPTG